MMYFEPIEDGDVRMVSLNYVKADEQSQYQIGEAADDSDKDNADGQNTNTARLKQNVSAFLYIPTQKSERKGV